MEVLTKKGEKMSPCAQAFNNLAQVAEAFTALESLIDDDPFHSVFVQLNLRLQSCVSDLDHSLTSPQ